MQARDVRKMTYDEYVALVAGGDEKYEYVNGEAYSMAGGTPRHSQVCANVGGALWSALRGKPCRVYQSDLRVRVETTGLATYPDVTVICGPVETSPKDRLAAINPRVLVEVTSESTEAYDPPECSAEPSRHNCVGPPFTAGTPAVRGAKFQHYQAIESLRDYLVVSGDRTQIDHYRRQDDGTWLLIPVGPTGRTSTRIESIDATLALDDVYAQLDGLDL